MRAVVVLVAVLSAGSANAQDQVWLKKASPNELWVNALITDCPISREEVLQVADSVLIRSRIKPAESFFINGKDGEGFGLSIRAFCVGQTAFSFDADFIGNPNGVSVRYNIVGYGGAGTFGGTKNTLLDAIKGSVEDAITDYLKANFDL